MSFALIVPTLNPGSLWEVWLKALSIQAANPDFVLVIDSSSTDGKVNAALDYNLQVITIPKKTFNHGSTRQWAFELVMDRVEFVVFMTQDAILADEQALANLLNSFANKAVAAAYGRQLPRDNARHFGTHARLFNYPNISKVKYLRDRNDLGIKVYFLSNSFAAYRVADMVAVGGFPATDFGEDTYVAARLLLNDRAIAYVADARVYHSHDYSLIQELNRYYSTGYFHARNSWLIDEFGGTGTEGWRFVSSEIKYLLEHNATHLIPIALLRTFVKYTGYRFGWTKGRGLPSSHRMA